MAEISSSIESCVAGIPAPRPALRDTLLYRYTPSSTEGAWGGGSCPEEPPAAKPGVNEAQNHKGEKITTRGAGLLLFQERCAISVLLLEKTSGELEAVQSCTRGNFLHSPPWRESAGEGDDGGAPQATLSAGTGRGLHASAPPLPPRSGSRTDGPSGGNGNAMGKSRR